MLQRRLEACYSATALALDVDGTTITRLQVLDRLARQTGMKVVYEGPAPRQLVTVSLKGRTPAEAVLSVLEAKVRVEAR